MRDYDKDPITIILELDEVEGTVNKGDFKDGIRLLAWSWGAESSASTGNSFKATDFTLTRYIDEVSPKIIVKMKENNILAGGKITVLMSKMKRKMIFKLTGVNIRTLSTGASCGEDCPTEEIHISAKEIDYQILPYTPESN